MFNLLTEQYLYCSKNCPIGRSKQATFLQDCESVFDAAYDMRDFVHKCSETCDIIKNWEDFKKTGIQK